LSGPNISCPTKLRPREGEVETNMAIVDRREIERLARAVLEHQLAVIRESLVRRGQSEEDADVIVRTCLEEFREGTPDLLEIFREKSLN
jgi:hypothetical protein